MSNCFGEFTTPALVISITGGILVVGGLIAMCWIIPKPTGKRNLHPLESDSSSKNNVAPANKIEETLSTCDIEGGK